MDNFNCLILVKTKDFINGIATDFCCGCYNPKYGCLICGVKLPMIGWSFLPICFFSVHQLYKYSVRYINIASDM